MSKRFNVLTKASICLMLVFTVVFINHAGTNAAPQVEQSGQYTILNPRPVNKVPIDVTPLTARLKNLEGKTIAVVANVAEPMPEIAKAVAKNVQGIKVIWVSTMPFFMPREERWGNKPAEVSKDPLIDIGEPGITQISLTDFMKNPKMADAIIVGNGFCGNAAATTVKYTAKFEKLGIPSVFIAFTDMISVCKKQMVSASVAMPALRGVTVTRGLTQAPKEKEAQAKVTEIVKNLTHPLTAQERYEGKYEFPKEPRTLYTGTLEQVQDFLRGDISKYVTTAPHAEYTDGSPVMPPTEAAVKRMLAGTSQKPNKVIGPLLPFNGIATVETVAINAVMAGCQPEYMPMLLALTENLAKVEIAEALQGAQGWYAFMVVACGPFSKEIGLNTGGPNLSGPAPLTPGVPANTTIGRFLRLMQINVGGIEPGESEAKGLGNPFKTSIVLAEANDESPWKQLSADFGFKDKSSTVSLIIAWGDVLSGFRASPAQSASKDIRESRLTPIATASKYLSRPQQGLIVLMSPQEAKNLQKAGYSKEDVKEWIWEHATDPWGIAKNIGLGQGVTRSVFSIQGVPLAMFPNEWKNPNFPEDNIVKYYPSLKHISIIVGPSSGYLGCIMNGSPRWTTAIDKWR